jgi:chromosome segregation ATPase
MALQPKRDNNSLTGIVSRAFGTRSSRRADDPVPDLDGVLNELDISDQQNETPAPDGRRDLEAHRQRLEQLLENARQIEEMLTKEAAQARALSENLQLDEKRAAVAQAAEDERKATAEASAYIQNSETAERYQAKADSQLAAARQELSAAEISVKDLQARLTQAQNVVVLSKAKVLESESRAKEAAKRAGLAKALRHDAEITVAKWREAREAAEAELSQAEEIASSIALTAETLKRIRDLGSIGLR